MPSDEYEGDDPRGFRQWLHSIGVRVAQDQWGYDPYYHVGGVPCILLGDHEPILFTLK